MLCGGGKAEDRDTGKGRLVSGWVGGKEKRKKYRKKGYRPSREWKEEIVGQGKMRCYKSLWVLHLSIFLILNIIPSMHT